ncbi:hypothetical protein BKA70DRAFT_1261368 [Coprinopsis sp. MPI-PUGE-AT-0042]|nr:hypothetical protein BKA70DRAFT_1261368 [Coprinopsis sp. MPI-PUGE-AT-0042]
MQTVLERALSLVRPFKCVFTASMPIQPQRAPRPPPDLPLELWLEIFQFATYVHRSVSIRPLDPFAFQKISRNVMGANTPALAWYTKLSLVQVCKSWRNVTLPLLYEHIIIRSPPRAKAILKVMQDSKTGGHTDPPLPSLGYGRFTRHIEILTHARGGGRLEYLQTAFMIFQHCPNLRILSGVWTHTLPVEFLKAISKLYGPSLEGLSWSEVADKLHPQELLTPAATFDLLGSFQALRTLDLKHVAPRFSGLLDPTLPPIESYGSMPVVIPFVEHLIISTHARSLSTVSLLSLPRLHTLTVKTPIPEVIDLYQLQKFLKVHGASLQTVDLPSPSPDDDLEPDSSYLRRSAKHVNPELFLDPNTCPNLISFSFPVTSPVPKLDPHPTLRKIGLRGVRADLLYPDRPSVVGSQLQAITVERYPALELVQTVGFLVEADVDNLIKDVFIWWVEKFEKMGVDFLDGEGILWAYTEPDPITSPLIDEERKKDQDRDAKKEGKRCPCHNAFVSESHSPPCNTLS